MRCVTPLAIVSLLLVVSAGCRKKEADPPDTAASEADAAPTPHISPRVLDLRVSSTLAPEERYHRYNLADSDPAHAWVEGVEGDGVGEWVTVVFDGTVALKEFSLTNGYPTNFEANNRVKDLEIRSNLKGKAPVNVVLKDTPDRQPVVLPQVLLGSELTLVIRSVYPGSKHRDTAIAELGSREWDTSDTPEAPWESAARAQDWPQQYVGEWNHEGERWSLWFGPDGGCTSRDVLEVETADGTLELQPRETPCTWLWSAGRKRAVVTLEEAEGPRELALFIDPAGNPDHLLWEPGNFAAARVRGED